MITPMKKMSQMRELRQRAQGQLSAPHEAPAAEASAAAALSVLHKLASSSDTAGHALTLLHEIQVHQVEIDMQADELRTGLAGCEAALDRQVEYHDHMPVACINIDASSRMLEINLTGARWLGLAREALLGQTIHAFLTPEGKDLLGAQMAAIAQGQPSASWATTLLCEAQKPLTVRAALSADVVAGRYILVLMS